MKFYRFDEYIGIYLETITFDGKVHETHPVEASDSAAPQRPLIAPVTNPIVPFSTTQEPPKTRSGEAAFFDGKNWVVKNILNPQSPANGKQEFNALGS